MLLMTLSLTLQTTNLQAAEIKGVVFDDSLRLGDITLPLRGTGLLKYLVFIDAYVAAFYLEEEVPSHKVLDDVPKCLKIQYFHAIKAKDFAVSTNKFIAANQSPETVEALKPKIQQINALYDDVKPGDRYALTNIPGIGTELSLNSKAKGTIQGADFAAAVFSIWLGSNPIDKGLKRQLLGAP
jgi:hypothetical protein